MINLQVLFDTRDIIMSSWLLLGEAPPDRRWQGDSQGLLWRACSPVSYLQVCKMRLKCLVRTMWS